jgi:hypothetical protein
MSVCGLKRNLRGGKLMYQFLKPEFVGLMNYDEKELVMFWAI